MEDDHTNDEMNGHELILRREPKPRYYSKLKPPNFIRIKVISMGAAETGKSCLIKRYCEERVIPIFQIF